MTTRSGKVNRSNDSPLRSLPPQPLQTQNSRSSAGYQKSTRHLVNTRSYKEGKRTAASEKSIQHQDHCGAGYSNSVINRKNPTDPPVTPSTYVEVRKCRPCDSWRDINLEEFKKKHGLERFDITFHGDEDDLTLEMIKAFPYDSMHLLTTVGQVEAGLWLPLYNEKDSFIYDVLSSRNTGNNRHRRSVVQYNGNWWRMLRVFNSRREHQISTDGTTVYTPENFNAAWADHTNKRNRVPWSVGPRRLSSTNTAFDHLPTFRDDHDYRWHRTPIVIVGPWAYGWCEMTPSVPRREAPDRYGDYCPWRLNLMGCDTEETECSDGGANALKRRAAVTKTKRTAKRIKHSSSESTTSGANGDYEMETDDSEEESVSNECAGECTYMHTIEKEGVHLDNSASNVSTAGGAKNTSEDGLHVSGSDSQAVDTNKSATCYKITLHPPSFNYPSNVSHAGVGKTSAGDSVLVGVSDSQMVEPKLASTIDKVAAHPASSDAWLDYHAELLEECSDRTPAVSLVDPIPNKVAVSNPVIVPGKGKDAEEVADADNCHVTAVDELMPFDDEASALELFSKRGMVSSLYTEGGGKLSTEMCEKMNLSSFEAVRDSFMNEKRIDASRSFVKFPKIGLEEMKTFVDGHSYWLPQFTIYTIAEWMDYCYFLYQFYKQKCDATHARLQRVLAECDIEKSQLANEQGQVQLTNKQAAESVDSERKVTELNKELENKQRELNDCRESYKKIENTRSLESSKIEGLEQELQKLQCQFNSSQDELERQRGLTRNAETEIQRLKEQMDVDAKSQAELVANAKKSVEHYYMQKADKETKQQVNKIYDEVQQLTGKVFRRL